MLRITLLTSLCLLTGLVSGCGEAAQSYQVRSAASVDLNCHESAIEFVTDKPFEKTVRGCGSQLTYVRHCGQGATGECFWIAFEPDSDKSAAAPVETTSEGDGQVDVSTESGESGTQVEASGSGGISLGGDD